MNQAHLHLILAHLPIVLVPTGFVFLLMGSLRKSSSALSHALWIFIAAGILVVPVFLLGEGAEEVVEHAKKASESIIENHEESAELALWLTAILGVVSLFCAFFKNALAKNAIIAILFLLSLSSTITLAIAANMGGKISHPEAYNADETSLTQSIGENEDDDED